MFFILHFRKKKTYPSLYVFLTTAVLELSLKRNTKKGYAYTAYLTSSEARFIKKFFQDFVVKTPSDYRYIIYSIKIWLGTSAEGCFAPEKDAFHALSIAKIIKLVDK